jgi:hypothetical protein
VSELGGAGSPPSKLLKLAGRRKQTLVVLTQVEHMRTEACARTASSR